MHKHRLCLGKHAFLDKDYGSKTTTRYASRKKLKPVGMNKRWRKNNQYHVKRKRRW